MAGLGSLIPQPRPGRAACPHQRRELLNAMLYWLGAGCAWRLLPNDMPPWKTVYHYFRWWRLDGHWQRIVRVLRARERVRQGRRPTPSAAILDSQSVKTTERGATRRRRRQEANGRKRHLLVDTLGLLAVQRWVVERSFAWLGRSRRLSKDYEFLPAASEAVIHLAMIQLLVRRLGLQPEFVTFMVR